MSCTRTVAVSYSSDAHTASPELNKLVDSLAHKAVATLKTLGFKVATVNAAMPGISVEDLVSNVHAVVILGGADIDPGVYGVTSDAPEVYGVNRNADEFEIALVRQCANVGTPLLGVCRGMQVMNVAFGGQLYQDIGTPSIHNKGTSSSEMVTHTIRVVPKTRLSVITENNRLDVESGHHQAISTLADNLIISATAGDGLIEAIEHPTDWVLGVQWHPEAPNANTNDLKRLFSALPLAPRKTEHKLDIQED